MIDFKLSNKFIDQYAKREVPWGYGDMSLAIFKSKYARRVHGENRTEEWFECVRRVVEKVFSVQKEHCARNGLEWNNVQAQKSAKTMYDKIFNFKFTPPGRGLFMMGATVVKDGELIDVIDVKGAAGLQNCGFVSTKNLASNPVAPFLFMADMSMFGVGVGFNLSGADTVTVKEPGANGSTLVIEDSREGWVEAVNVTLGSYFGGSSYKLDYSEIRPRGALIETFGGIAPGAGPLMKLCEENIPKILDPLIGEYLNSVAIVDLMNFIGLCVVSGNVRRTAELAIGDPWDEDYIEMKNYKLHQKELDERRGMSNNSIYATIGEDYDKIAEHIAANGEPGVIWMENVHSFGRKVDGFNDEDEAEGFNPCVEQPLFDRELCTLVESYPANHDNAEEFLETLKFAYMYAKTVTLIPTHNPHTNAVMTRNRRIGTSMSGIEQAITKFGKRVFLEEFCDAGYKEIRQWDRVYSNWLGVPRSIRVTTVKPSGTVSLLAGASPGVHKPILRKYIRYVKFDDNDPILKMLDDAGYEIEYDARNDESNAMFVLFPIEESKEVRYTEEETNIWEQFQSLADMQYWWSDNGVSCTVKFNPDTEATQIKDCLETYEDKIKAVSLLPKWGHMFIQAPYTLVSDDFDDKERYIKDHKIIWTKDEFEKYRASINHNIFRKAVKRLKKEGTGEQFCSNDTCELPIGEK